MKLTRKTRNALWGYAFISLWMVGFAFFFLKPIIQSFIFGLSDITLSETGFKSTFIGFANYQAAFLKDEWFPRHLTNSFISLFADVPAILVFSFIVSILLSKNIKGGSVFKAIIFMTVILSSGVFSIFQANVDTASVSQISQSAQNVSIFNIANNISIEKLLTDAGISQNIVGYIVGPVVRIFQIMTRSGIQIFVLLAGLKSISPSIFEASYVEGATSWEVFWKVTFPMLSPLMLVNVVYTIIDSFTDNSNIVVQVIYGQAFGSLRFGYSSALAWIYFVLISIVLAVAGFLISKKTFYYN